MADSGSAPIVTPPPRPNRAVVTVLGLGVVAGGAGLLSVRTGIGNPRPDSEGPATMLLAVCGLLLVANAVNLAVMARRRRDAAPLVGSGSPCAVHLLPMLADRAGFLFFVLQPVDGRPPLGRIGLIRITRDFDPWATFWAWGPLREGQPIALSSTDGRQVVLPSTRLLAVGGAPPPSPAVTAVVGRVVGWPHPGGMHQAPQVAAVDRAIVEWRRRSRIIGPAISFIPTGLVSIALTQADTMSSSGRFLVAMVVWVAAMAASASVCQAPLRAVSSAAARELGVKAGRSTQVLAQIRWDAVLGGQLAVPHGRDRGADGGGWTSRPHPPAPR